MPDINSAMGTLREFLRSTDFEQSPRAGQITEPFILLTRGDSIVFLRETDAEKYSEIVGEIFDSIPANELISRAAVERLIGDIVVAVSQSRREGIADFEGIIKAQLGDLKAKLQAPPLEWEFFVPVLGFAPSELPFAVGQVEFYLADSTGVREFWKRAIEVAPEKYENAQPSEMLPLADFTTLSNQAMARLRISAIESEAAEVQALNAIRRTLDCINFYCSKNRGTGLYIWGDVGRGSRLVLGLKLTQPAAAMARTARIPPSRGLPIQQISRSPGFSRMSELLRNRQRTDLEDRILKAMQWAGRARVEPRREESFFLFAVALETLLLGDSRDPSEVQYKLKLRCVHLLAAADLDSRKLAFKQIGDLYRTRSKIVHTGRFEITASELSMIEEYTRIALFIILDREPFRSMTEEPELEAWFEARILGSDQALNPSK